MGFEPGGRADKLGNRYEGRWVAKQLLRLLNEEISSVTIEAIGDDEKGVDLRIELKNGKRQAQQCKARNRSKESWSIGDLKARDILENLRIQLDRDSRNEFVLISGIPATLFGDICDSARNSNGNSEDFYRYQIQSVGTERLGAFRQFCQAVSLNHEDKSDRGRAFDYLRRTRVELYPGDENVFGDLLTTAGFLLTGEPETAIAVLLTYAENHDRLGTPIYVDELRNHLVTQYIYPQNLAHDDRVAPAIENQQQEFDESIRPLLIGNSLIHRGETDKCLEALRVNGMVILHGPAGSGKSGVLYELTRELRDEGIVCLPLRLDRRVPEKTAVQFGHDMGLPASPVNCLAALAGERSCILILDQLDAIRWTSAHSANALDVCKEMVRQVLSFRRDGKAISVVLSCRTFDLEHDPEIRNWLNDQTVTHWTKIEVKPLPEGTVRNIVGAAFEGMTERQRLILANPQNLALWVELCKQGELPVFRSATELMRRFWEYQRKNIEELRISAGDINNVQDCLINWLEQHNRISVPARVVNLHCSTRAIKAFKSHGIIQEQNNMVTFCHQSYLDFLIAERVVSEIEVGGNILDWLGSRERQTLVRREQLRQVLVILADELLTEYLASIKQILAAEGLRFHLKHLVLELIGQMDEVPELIADYCILLLNVDYWRPHVLETVCSGHTPFVRLLIDRGIIGEWLNSEEEEIVNRALWLLRSVAEKLPDEVTELIAPFTGKGNEWASRILNTICWQIADDSDAMFELRLRLARSGTVSPFIDWKGLCARHPIRALRLIDAILSTRTPGEDDSDPLRQKTRLDEWYEEDLRALSHSAECHPIETWDLFIPHVLRLTSYEASPDDSMIEKWQKDSIRTNPRSLGIERGVVELLIKAGQKLAQQSPEPLLEKTKALENSPSRVMQEILIEVYASLSKQFADVGIRWLLDDLSRVRLGDGYSEPKWMPAVRLIKALSPHCSLNLFRDLEQTLVYYHHPDEIRSAKYCLDARKHGYISHYWGHYWGQAQYFLLPALSPNRITEATADLIRVLKRKFKGYPTWRFLRMGPVTGGFIGSKLDKNLERISDRAWLEIVGNKEIPYDDHGKWQQVNEDYAVVSSVWQFSRSLGRIAKRYPERFGRLALRFVKDTHSSYVSAILNAMALTKPDSEVPEEKKPAWEPASVDTVLAVWERFCDLSDREVAISFCRLIEARSDETWPNNAVDRLLHFAVNHPDLEPGKLNVHCDKSADEATVEMLFQNTINCVRGVAAKAMGELLWHHPDWLDKMKPAIGALVTDFHPVVRMAAVLTLLPILKIERRQAVAWFCTASKEDVRVAASPFAIRFFNYTIQEYAEQLTPIIRDMFCSKLPDVSKQGAQAVTAYFLFYGLFEDEFRACREGTVPQREGMAAVAADLVADDKYAQQCRELLSHFLNDPEKDVRMAAARMFSKEFFDSTENISLTRLYVKSTAFVDDSFRLFRYLQDYKDSLIPFYEIILDVCETLTTTLLEETRKSGMPMRHLIGDMSPLLLRLYEQTQEERPDIAYRCLDAWDILFEKRVGSTRELTKGIEK